MDGEYLGTIEDFMLDIGSGRIAYAVLSFGGIMGMGGKLSAVPTKMPDVSVGAHN